MLTNLFRLNGSPAIIAPNGPYPAMSTDSVVKDTVYRQNPWAPPLRDIRNVKFENVSLSKMTMSQLTFTDCEFRDCLFFGTHFDEVDFHNCVFVDCTMWKCRFHRVYLDPKKIKLGTRYAVEASNVGISVFQALLSNYAEERQDHFYMISDIRFRRWKRYQIAYDRRRKRIGPLRAKWRWFWNIFYEVLAGFGYRPVRFFLWTIAIFFVVSALNYVSLGQSLVIQHEHQASPPGFIDTAFYTFCVLTVLGFSFVTPLTTAAKLFTVVEALFAVGWLAMFTAVVVKRFIR